MGGNNLPNFKIYFLATEIKTMHGDFPNSPGVKTLSFYFRGHGFDPWSGN